MPHVNGVPDKTKWLLQSKNNLDTVDANFQDCMHILNFMY